MECLFLPIPVSFKPLLTPQFQLKRPTPLSVNSFLPPQIPSGLCPPATMRPLWHFPYSIVIVGVCSLIKYPAPRLRAWVAVGPFPNERGYYHKSCDVLSTWGPLPPYPQPLDLQSLFCAGQPCRAPAHCSLPEPDQGCIKSPKPCERFLWRQAQLQPQPHPSATKEILA